MTAILATWIANSLALYAVAYLMAGISLGSLRDAFIAGAVLSLINALVKPVLLLLTLPLTVLTLGLFYFILTAFCLWLTAEFVSGLTVEGWFSIIVAALLVSILSTFTARILKNAAKESHA